MRIIAILSTALLCACDAQSTQQFAGALVGALGQQYNRNRDNSDGYRAPAPYYPQYQRYPQGVDATGYVEAPSYSGGSPPFPGGPSYNPGLEAGSPFESSNGLVAGVPAGPYPGAGKEALGGPGTCHAHVKPTIDKATRGVATPGTCD